MRIFIAVFCSLVFFYEFKSYITGKKEGISTTIKHNRHYENVYLFFWLQIIMMLSVNCFYQFDWLEEYVLLLYLRFSLLWFLCHRPYQKAIHNFGQFVNLILVMLFLSWSVARKYLLMFQEEDNEILLVFGIIILMSIALLLTAIRTIVQIRHNCQFGKKSGKKSKGKKYRR